MKLFTLSVLAALALAAPASAATFTSSVTIDQTYAGFADVTLPRYDGGGTITGVTFVFSGETGTYKDVSAGDDPQTRPAEDVSWSISLNGPGIVDGGSESFERLASVLIETQFPETELPAAPGELVTIATPTLPFLLTASDTRFGLYAGPGTNNFILATDLVFATRFGGTLTQVITTAVPEPAGWALMIGGFGLAGGALRKRSAGAYARI